MLPDGFAVQIDRSVKILDSGAALLGGSPRRILRLSPTAQRLLAVPGGRLEVRDATTAQLARTLLDATVAHPRPAGGPSHRDVTVVIPVRDNAPGLGRLVASLRGLRVVVVDDGSAIPVDAGRLAGAPDEVTVHRHDVSRGPAAARNTGLASCDTDFVAFLDSDVVPRRGWLEALLGHFCDPAVGLVAPRIVALPGPDGLVHRYEASHSSLDLGQREAPVVPYGMVSYVPSAAIVCRRRAIREVGGFDEKLSAGEDVDLCWRLADAGFRLRYEPVAQVAHEHRSRPMEWLSRRCFYGTSAAPLALRHPDKTAALVMPRWSLLAWLAAASGTRAGLLVGLVCAGQYGRRVVRSARAGKVGDPGPAEVTRLVLGGLGAGAVQLSSTLCRSYWPAALGGALASRRLRRAVLAAAAVDAVHGWSGRTAAGDSQAGPIGPLGYLLLKRLDDLAYGTGLWAGALRQRTLLPLRPDIRP